jgi:hypothetical protein
MCKPGTLNINGDTWTATCCSTDNCNEKIIQSLFGNLTEGTSSDVSKSTTLSAYKDTTTTSNFISDVSKSTTLSAYKDTTTTSNFISDVSKSTTLSAYNDTTTTSNFISDVSKSTTLSAYKDTTTTSNLSNSRYLKRGSLIFYVLIFILFSGL